MNTNRKNQIKTREELCSGFYGFCIRQLDTLNNYYSASDQTFFAVSMTKLNLAHC